MTAERNDPTSSGFTPPATGGARLSFNEAEMLCLKAARGAGMSWGLAEEAGFAARWLYARGIDGPAALLAHLEWADGRPCDAVRPAAVGDLRAHDGGLLCPIALGTAVSDSADLGKAGTSAVTGPVHRPVLVLPFLHALARGSGKTMALAWAGHRVTVGPDGDVRGDVAPLSALERAELELSQGASAEREPRRPDRAAPLSAQTLSRLDDYAMRTTVPASASSRADAGSASGDND
jgi:hypothetical protein